MGPPWRPQPAAPNQLYNKDRCESDCTRHEDHPPHVRRTRRRRARSGAAARRHRAPATHRTASRSPAVPGADRVHAEGRRPEDRALPADASSRHRRRVQGCAGVESRATCSASAPTACSTISARTPGLPVGAAEPLGGWEAPADGKHGTELRGHFTGHFLSRERATLGLHGRQGGQVKRRRHGRRTRKVPGEARRADI